jgi:hypothetical protein
VKKQANGNYLAFRHTGWAFAGLTQKKRPGGSIKLLAKFIHQTENIRNFSKVNHAGLLLII